MAEYVDENEAFPEENVKKMSKLGMMGIYFPKEYGGAGADVLSYVMAVEEMSKVCATKAEISLVLRPRLSSFTPVMAMMMNTLA